MATIKQERQVLDQLLNTVSPLSVDNTNLINNKAAESVSNTPAKSVSTQSVVDNTTGAGLTSELAFHFDYDSIKKGIRKKARKTVLNIISHIIPKQYQDEDYVQDKAEQDILTLTDLYMQLEVNNIMQRSLMESVARGNSMPRMYEVFGQLSDKIASINKQILTTEQTVRKTYLDLKFEIYDKTTEEIPTQISAGSADISALPNMSGTVVTSSKQLMEIAKKKHIEKMRSIKDTEFIEEN
jgi:hypothetical protein